MRRARKEGKWMGPAPVGYKNKITEDGHKYIAIDPIRGAIVKWAFETLATGRYNVEQIFGIANDQGLNCAKNTFWHMLRNPTYYGMIYVGKYKDESARLVRGKHEPLIPESLFQDVQDFLDGRKKTYSTTVDSQEELQLRGHLLCPKCGQTTNGECVKRQEQYSILLLPLPVSLWYTFQS